MTRSGEFFMNKTTGSGHAQDLSKLKSGQTKEDRQRELLWNSAMHCHPAKGHIRPKISTMPRQQSESAAFLDIYKLVIEKKRLQQEVQGMDQRRQHIIDRLTVLEVQITELENVAHHLRNASPKTPGAREQSQPMPSPINSPTNRRLETERLETERLKTLFLEY